MLRSLVETLTGEISGLRCMDHVQTISRHHRIQASPGYRAAARECLKIFIDAGIQARITTYPATGRNREWTHLTPREWACEDAELWILDEDGRRKERLAWFQEANLSVIQRSAATAPDGVMAELVVVDRAESSDAWSDGRAAGKIALVGNGDIHRIWENARSAGALGLITARMSYMPPTRPEGDLPDALQYTSFWWSVDEPEGWGFVVSTRTGERLRRLAARGPARVWARVNTRSYDGTIENVEAVIPGTGEGEILVVSHLCHPRPSAGDNATGPATAMESARALHRLIENGSLPRPRRSIRFLHPPEMTGTYAHLAAMTPEERSRIAAGLNLDMVGQKQSETGSVLLCEYPPLACPSFTGDLLSLAVREVAAELAPHGAARNRFAGFRHSVVDFCGGSDHYILSDPSVGIPSPMLIQWPDRFYHTSADTPDRCDPEMMARVAVMSGAYAYFLASAGVREVAWLAGEMTALFPAQLHAAMEGCSDPEAMAGFRVDRKLADLDSLRRLLRPDEQAQVERRLEVCATQVKLIAEMELQRTSLSAAEPVGPAEGGMTAGWLETADLRQIRPRRRHPGPITLRSYWRLLSQADLSSWREFEAAHRGGSRLNDYLCYWCDGQRTLSEIVRLAALETGIRDDSWALGFFQLLGRLDLAEGV